MEYDMSDLIDISRIQKLTDSFHKATGIPSAVIGSSGIVITQAGWQNICLNFHRKNPEAEKKCLESACQIKKRLNNGKPYVVHKCLNGLIDAAAPVVIAGEHAAYVTTGQLLFKKPDTNEREYFRRQAREFEFDESEYLEALSTVPIIPEDRVEAILDYLSSFAGMLAELGYTQMRQLEAAKALQNAHDELEERVRERTAELMTANEQLRQEIKDRKQAESALRENRDRVETILNSMPAGTVMIDEVTKEIIEANPQAISMIGAPVENIVGSHCSKFLCSKQKNICPITDLGKPDDSSENILFTADGEGLPIQKKVVSIKIDDRRCLIESFIDISEHKQLEEERKKLEIQLNYAQRMEAIGTLAAGVAHNFNNILGGIIGNAELALLDIDSDHPNHEKLQTINELVEKGAKLTGQLLGYARKGRYEIKSISLNQLVEETAYTLSSSRKDINVHLELSDNQFGIIADQDKIEQVLLALYANAAEAMPGVGDLFLKTTNISHKEMKGKPYDPKPGNYVMLTVRDTGKGMDEKTRERIFEPFFSTKGLAEATGLGLASAYGIIKAHGGYLDVESKKGYGTAFRIYLLTSNNETVKETKFPVKLIKGNGTVLLVDDENVILDVGSQMITKMGYGVLTANSGKSAIENFREHDREIDIVILDMVMPEMDGGDTYDILKKINKEVKVILSSGYSIDGKAEEIMNRGCSGFIQKPFSMKELSQKISKILGDNAVSQTSTCLQ